MLYSIVNAINDINEKIEQKHQKQDQKQDQNQNHAQDSHKIKDPYGVLELWRSRL